MFKYNLSICNFAAAAMLIITSSLLWQFSMFFQNQRISLSVPNYTNHLVMNINQQPPIDDVKSIVVINDVENRLDSKIKSDLNKLKSVEITFEKNYQIKSTRVAKHVAPRSKRDIEKSDRAESYIKSSVLDDTAISTRVKGQDKLIVKSFIINQSIGLAWSEKFKNFEIEKHLVAVNDKVINDEVNLAIASTLKTKREAKISPVQAIVHPPKTDATNKPKKVDLDGPIALIKGNVKQDTASPVSNVENNNITDSVASITESVKGEDGDELTFYEYSIDQKGDIKVKTGVLDDEYSNIDKKIPDQVKNENIVATTTPEIPKNSVISNSGATTDYSPVQSQIVDTQNPDKEFFEPMSTQKYAPSKFVRPRVEYSTKVQQRSFFTIHPQLAQINGRNNYVVVSNSSLSPLYDPNEQINYSDTDNGFVIDYNTNNISQFSATIRGDSFLPTKVTLDFEYWKEQQLDEVGVPLIPIDSLESLASKYKLNMNGGFLLVELDDSIDRINIDSISEKMFYLNDKFKVVKSSDEYQFVLFVGVKPGIFAITADTLEGDFVQKFISVVDSEITYEYASVKKTNQTRVEVFENRVLGQKPIPLDIDSDKVSYFNQKLSTTKLSPNTINVALPATLQQSRSYLQFSHLSDDIFVGLSNKSKIEIPDNDYIVQIYDLFNIRELQGQCIVQANLTSNPIDILVEGQGLENSMNLTTAYLNQEGTFSHELINNSKKLFIYGEEEGTVYLKIKYADGKEDMLNTFCSKSTYLVEQL